MNTPLQGTGVVLGFRFRTGMKRFINKLLSQKDLGSILNTYFFNVESHFIKYLIIFQYKS